jgi:hypothetical protein
MGFKPKVPKPKPIPKPVPVSKKQDEDIVGTGEDERRRIAAMAGRANTVTSRANLLG